MFPNPAFDVGAVLRRARPLGFGDHGRHTQRVSGLPELNGELPVSPSGISEVLQQGHDVLIDDGLVRLRVDSVESGRAQCTVVEPDIDRIRAMGFRVLSGNYMSETDVVRRALV